MSACQSLTHTELGRARNAAIWRTFRTQRWVSVSETGAGSRIPALCLLGQYFGVTFLEYARVRSKFGTGGAWSSVTRQCRPDHRAHTLAGSP